MPRRREMPELEVGRLAAPGGLPAGFIAWDYTTVKWTTPLRPWSRRRSEVVPALHARLVMLAGEFSGDHDDFYETLRGKPEVYSGTFTYKGVQFRGEELHGDEAAAVIEEHFKDLALSAPPGHSHCIRLCRYPSAIGAARWGCRSTEGSADFAHGVGRTVPVVASCARRHVMARVDVPSPVVLGTYRWLRPHADSAEDEAACGGSGSRRT